MKITKIKILKNKVSITFDNKSKLSIDKNVYTNFYLYEGKEIDKKEYKSLIDLNNSNALLEYALKVRAKSLYSEYQMREKLYKKEASKKEVDKVIKILKGYDLINDEAYARDLLEYYNSLNYGKNKIIHKISEKGIFDKEINKLSFPVSMERKKANNNLSKLEKKYDKYNYSSKKSHIYNAYIQLGFDSEISSEMINKISKPDSKSEKEKLQNDYKKVKTRLERKYQGKELKQKIIQSLMQKGYRLNDIINLVK